MRGLDRRPGTGLVEFGWPRPRSLPVRRRSATTRGCRRSPSVSPTRAPARRGGNTSMRGPGSKPRPRDRRRPRAARCARARESAASRSPRAGADGLDRPTVAVDPHRDPVDQPGGRRARRDRWLGGRNLAATSPGIQALHSAPRWLKSQPRVIRHDVVVDEQAAQKTPGWGRPAPPPARRRPRSWSAHPGSTSSARRSAPPSESAWMPVPSPPCGRAVTGRAWSSQTRSRATAHSRSCGPPGVSASCRQRGHRGHDEGVRHGSRSRSATGLPRGVRPARRDGCMLVAGGD